MNYLYRLCICAVIIFVAPLAHAGTLSFAPAKDTVALEEQFFVDVFLDPEHQSINGIEGSISYPKDTITFVQAEEGKSIVNAWIEKPHSSSSGVISFAGIIPNGFTGVIDPFNSRKVSPGLVVRLVFEGHARGVGELKMISGAITENDGAGTTHTLRSLSQMITVTALHGKTHYVPFTDSVPEIEAYITTDKDVYKGKYVLIFSAHDSASGIKEVLVKEGDREWKKADESPYVLEDQLRKGRVVIQAVSFGDVKGFATIEPLPSPVFSVYNIIVLFLVLIVLLIALKYARRKKIF